LVEINLANYTDTFPYKEEVTGSNPVAPTRVFQKYTLQKYKKPHNNRTFCFITL